jgi:hypothetical protein
VGTARHVRPVPARLAAPPSALHRPTGTVDAPRSAAMLPASPRPKIKSDIETLFSTLFQVRPNPVLANARVFYKNDLMRVRKWPMVCEKAFRRSHLNSAQHQCNWRASFRRDAFRSSIQGYPLGSRAADDPGKH